MFHLVMTVTNIPTKYVSVSAPNFIRTNCVVGTIYRAVISSVSTKHVMYEDFTTYT